MTEPIMQSFEIISDNEEIQAIHLAQEGILLIPEELREDGARRVIRYLEDYWLSTRKATNA